MPFGQQPLKGAPPLWCLLALGKSMRARKACQPDVRLSCPQDSGFRPNQGERLIPILTRRYLCCLRHLLLDVLQLYTFVAPSSAPRYRHDLELE